MSQLTDDLSGDAAEANEIRFPHANIVAIAAISQVLATTLGPTSRDKLVINQLATRDEPDHPSMPAMDDYVVASDGATILKALPLEHPVGSVLERVVGPERPGDTEVEGEDIPDGVTTTVVLTAALLRKAESLIDMGVHPSDIQRGYEAGLGVAFGTIDAETQPLNSLGEKSTVERAVARTALTGNDIAGFAEKWAELAAEAASQIGMPNERSLAVRQISKGSIASSRLVLGAVLDRNEVCHDEMPTRLEDANVLVLSGYEKGGGLQDPDLPQEMTARPTSPEELSEFDEVFSSRRERITESLVENAVDVVVARQGISREYQQLLADHGIMGIRRVNRLDLQQIARATGAEPVQDLSDVTAADLGTAGLVEEVMREPRRHRRRSRRMVIFDRCTRPKSVCVMLRGVTGQVADQATTEIRKAAASVARANGHASSPLGVVPGGGAIDIEIARQVRAAAPSDNSRAQLGMTAFAEAVERLTSTLARNAGEDPLAVISNLRAMHERGRTATGVIFPENALRDAVDAGVLDPTATRRRAYATATNVANRVLRIDDAIDVIHVHEPAGPDESINDEAAERHMEYLKDRDNGR